MPSDRLRIGKWASARGFCAWSIETDMLNETFLIVLRVNIERYSQAQASGLRSAGICGLD